MLRRRDVLLGVSASMLAPRAASAQQKYPERPIRLVIPFPPGGVNDAIGRPWADRMKSLLGTVVVENQGGAGGSIGAAAVARAPADGYTLLLGGGGSQIINPVAATRPPYDTVKDFEPIAIVALTTMAIAVHPSLPVHGLGELIAYSKANPDKLSYGSSGAGTSIHLAAELFKIRTGTTMTHVPFRSSGDIMNNLTGGHINLAFDNITLAWPQVQAGRLRALAVSSTERSAIAPDVPTVADTIPGFEATSWHGVFAPAGTPKPIVDKMAAEMKRILELPDVKDKLFEIGAVASPMKPEDFVKFIDGERTKWADVVKASGAKMD